MSVIKRIVAIFLVGAMLLDPTLLQAFESTANHIAPLVVPTLFINQALTLKVAEMVHPLGDFPSIRNWQSREVQTMSDRLGARRTPQLVRRPIIRGEVSQVEFESLKQDMAQRYPTLRDTLDKITRIRYAAPVSLNGAATLQPRSDQPSQWEMIVDERYRGFDPAVRQAFLKLHMVHETSELHLTPAGQPLQTEINREIAAVLVQGNLFLSLSNPERATLLAAAQALDKQEPQESDRFGPVLDFYEKAQLFQNLRLTANRPKLLEMMRVYPDIDVKTYDEATVDQYLAELLPPAKPGEREKLLAAVRGGAEGTFGQLRALVAPVVSATAKPVSDSGMRRAIRMMTGTANTHFESIFTVSEAFTTNDPNELGLVIIDVDGQGGWTIRASRGFSKEECRSHLQNRFHWGPASGEDPVIRIRQEERAVVIVAKESFLQANSTELKAASRLGCIRFERDLPRRIEDFKISVRGFNALKNALIESLEELSELTKYDLLGLPDVGRRTIREFQDLLSQQGLSLAKTPNPDLRWRELVHFLARTWKMGKGDYSRLTESFKKAGTHSFFDLSVPSSAQGVAAIAVPIVSQDPVRALERIVEQIEQAVRDRSILDGNALGLSALKNRLKDHKRWPTINTTAQMEAPSFDLAGAESVDDLIAKVNEFIWQLNSAVGGPVWAIAIPDTSDPADGVDLVLFRLARAAAMIVSLGTPAEPLTQAIEKAVTQVIDFGQQREPVSERDRLLEALKTGTISVSDGFRQLQNLEQSGAPLESVHKVEDGVQRTAMDLMLKALQKPTAIYPGAGKPALALWQGELAVHHPQWGSAQDKTSSDAQIYEATYLLLVEAVQALRRAAPALQIDGPIWDFKGDRAAGLGIDSKLWQEDRVSDEELEELAGNLRRYFEDRLSGNQSPQGDQPEAQAPDKPIEKAELSVRTYNILNNEDIHTLHELAQFTERQVLDMGAGNSGNRNRRMLHEIDDLLEQNHLTLSTTPDPALRWRGLVKFLVKTWNLNWEKKRELIQAFKDAENRPSFSMPMLLHTSQVFMDIPIVSRDPETALRAMIEYIESLVMSGLTPSSFGLSLLQKKLSEYEKEASPLLDLADARSPSEIRDKTVEFITTYGFGSLLQGDRDADPISDTLLLLARIPVSGLPVATVTKAVEEVITAAHTIRSEKKSIDSAGASVLENQPWWLNLKNTLEQRLGIVITISHEERNPSPTFVSPKDHSTLAGVQIAQTLDQASAVIEAVRTVLSSTMALNNVIEQFGGDWSEKLSTWYFAYRQKERFESGALQAKEDKDKQKAAASNSHMDGASLSSDIQTLDEKQSEYMRLSAELSAAVDSKGFDHPDVEALVKHIHEVKTQLSNLKSRITKESKGSPGQRNSTPSLEDVVEFVSTVLRLKAKDQKALREGLTGIAPKDLLLLHPGYFENGYLQGRLGGRIYSRDPVGILREIIRIIEGGWCPAFFDADPLPKLKEKLEEWEKLATPPMADRLGARRISQSPRQPIIRGEVAKSEFEPIQQDLAEYYPALRDTVNKITRVRYAASVSINGAATLRPRSDHPDEWEMIVDDRYRALDTGVRQTFLRLHLAHEATELHLTPGGEPVQTEINRELAAVLVQAQVYFGLSDQQKAALLQAAQALDKEESNETHRFTPVLEFYNSAKDFSSLRALAYRPTLLKFIDNYPGIDVSLYTETALESHLQAILGSEKPGRDADKPLSERDQLLAAVLAGTDGAFNQLCALLAPITAGETNTTHRDKSPQISLELRQILEAISKGDTAAIEQWKKRNFTVPFGDIFAHLGAKETVPNNDLKGALILTTAAPAGLNFWRFKAIEGTEIVYTNPFKPEEEYRESAVKLANGFTRLVATAQEVESIRLAIPSSAYAKFLDDVEKLPWMTPNSGSQRHIGSFVKKGQQSGILLDPSRSLLLATRFDNGVTNPGFAIKWEPFEAPGKSFQLSYICLDDRQLPAHFLTLEASAYRGLSLAQNNKHLTLFLSPEGFAQVPDGLRKGDTLGGYSWEILPEKQESVDSKVAGMDPESERRDLIQIAAMRGEQAAAVELNRRFKGKSGNDLWKALGLARGRYDEVRDNDLMVWDFGDTPSLHKIKGHRPDGDFDVIDLRDNKEWIFDNVAWTHYRFRRLATAEALDAARPAVPMGAPAFDLSGVKTVEELFERTVNFAAKLNLMVRGPAFTDASSADDRVESAILCLAHVYSVISSLEQPVTPLLLAIDEAVAKVTEAAKRLDPREERTRLLAALRAGTIPFDNVLQALQAVAGKLEPVKVEQKPAASGMREALLQLTNGQSDETFSHVYTTSIDTTGQGQDEMWEVRIWATDAKWSVWAKPLNPERNQEHLYEWTSELPAGDPVHSVLQKGDHLEIQVERAFYERLKLPQHPAVRFVTSDETKHVKPIPDEEALQLIDEIFKPSSRTGFSVTIKKPVVMSWNPIDIRLDDNLRGTGAINIIDAVLAQSDQEEKDKTDTVSTELVRLRLKRYELAKRQKFTNGELLSSEAMGPAKDLIERFPEPSLLTVQELVGSELGIGDKFRITPGKGTPSVLSESWSLTDLLDLRIDGSTDDPSAILFAVILSIAKSAKSRNSTNLYRKLDRLSRVLLVWQNRELAASHHAQIGSAAQDYDAFFKAVVSNSSVAIEALQTRLTTGDNLRGLNLRSLALKNAISDLEEGDILIMSNQLETKFYIVSTKSSDGQSITGASVVNGALCQFTSNDFYSGFVRRLASAKEIEEAVLQAPSRAKELEQIKKDLIKAAGNPDAILFREALDRLNDRPQAQRDAFLQSLPVVSFEGNDSVRPHDLIVFMEYVGELKLVVTKAVYFDQTKGWMTTRPDGHGYQLGKGHFGISSIRRLATADELEAVRRGIAIPRLIPDEEALQALKTILLNKAPEADRALQWAWTNQDNSVRFTFAKDGIATIILPQSLQGSGSIQILDSVLSNWDKEDKKNTDPSLPSIIRLRLKRVELVNRQGWTTGEMGKHEAHGPAKEAIQRYVDATKKDLDALQRNTPISMGDAEILDRLRQRDGPEPISPIQSLYADIGHLMEVAERKLEPPVVSGRVSELYALLDRNSRVLLAWQDGALTRAVELEQIKKDLMKTVSNPDTSLFNQTLERLNNVLTSAQRVEFIESLPIVSLEGDESVKPNDLIVFLHHDHGEVKLMATKAVRFDQTNGWITTRPDGHVYPLGRDYFAAKIVRRLATAEELDAAPRSDVLGPTSTINPSGASVLKQTLELLNPMTWENDQGRWRFKPPLKDHLDSTLADPVDQCVILLIQALNTLADFGASEAQNAVIRALKRLRARTPSGGDQTRKPDDKTNANKDLVRFLRKTMGFVTVLGDNLDFSAQPIVGLDRSYTVTLPHKLNQDPLVYLEWIERAASQSLDRDQKRLLVDEIRRLALARQADLSSPARMATDLDALPPTWMRTHDSYALVCTYSTQKTGDKAWTAIQAKLQHQYDEILEIEMATFREPSGSGAEAKPFILTLQVKNGTYELRLGYLPVYEGTSNPYRRMQWIEKSGFQELLVVVSDEVWPTIKDQSGITGQTPDGVHWRIIPESEWKGHQTPALDRGGRNPGGPSTPSTSLLIQSPIAARAVAERRTIGQKGATSLEFLGEAMLFFTPTLFRHFHRRMPSSKQLLRRAA